MIRFLDLIQFSMIFSEAGVTGYDEEAIKMHVDKHVLTISGEEGKEEEAREYYAREIYTPEFRRSFSLPENADEGAISADYKNGMLLVTIPKKPEAQPRRIEVKINK